MEEIVYKLLKERWPDAEIKIDFSDQKHMAVEISSAVFADKKILDQHKMVYEVLGDLLQSGELHALRLKTKII